MMLFSTLGVIALITYLACLQHCKAFVFNHKPHFRSLSRLLSVQKSNPSDTFPAFDDYCEEEIGGQDIATHIQMLDNSLHNLTGKGIIERIGISDNIDNLSTQKEFVYKNICMNERWVLISHGIEEDPIYNFVNVAGLKAFVRTWDEFKKLPSRQSVVFQTTDEKLRIELMKKVTTCGFVEGASGIRVRGDGQFLRLVDAVVRLAIYLQCFYFSILV